MGFLDDAYIQVLGLLICLVIIGMIWNLVRIAMIEHQYRKDWKALCAAARRAVNANQEIPAISADMLNQTITRPVVAASVYDAVMTQSAPVPYRGDHEQS